MEHNTSQISSAEPPPKLTGATSATGSEDARFPGTEVLQNLNGRSAVALSRIHVPAGEDIGPRSDESPSCLIVLRGSAVLIGQTRQDVESDDLIKVPPGEEYGFTRIGPEGLDLLHVLLPRERDARDQEVTLTSVLERNEVRSARFLHDRFFSLFRNGEVNTERARTATLQCLRVFSDVFQNLLFTRQATCQNPAFMAAFQEHLQEELGHNELVKAPENPRISADPILRSTATWFCQRMFVLDNVEKAAVNLVLETAGHEFGHLAAPSFAGSESAEYFHTHGEADEGHSDDAARLLEGQHPETYRALYQVVEDTWNMLETMTRRFVYWIEREKWA